MEHEIWKRYKDTTLEVSNLGGVRHLVTKRERDITTNGSGYRCVSITKDCKATTYSVHRMVAETFIPMINGKTHVNHKDGVKLNNAVFNLEWVTPSENTIHALETGLKSKGSDLKWAVLTETDVIAIKDALTEGVTASKLAKLFNVSVGTISNLRNGRAWKNVGVDVPKLERKDSTRKITIEDIPNIRSYIKNGATDTEIGKIYGCARGTIYRIRSGQNWKNY